MTLRTKLSWTIAIAVTLAPATGAWSAQCSNNLKQLGIATVHIGPGLPAGQLRCELCSDGRVAELHLHRQPEAGGAELVGRGPARLDSCPPDVLTRGFGRATAHTAETPRGTRLELRSEELRGCRAEAILVLDPAGDTASAATSLAHPGGVQVEAKFADGSVRFIRDGTPLGPIPVKVKQISDGTSNTILIGEQHAAARQALEEAFRAKTPLTVELETRNAQRRYHKVTLRDAVVATLELDPRTRALEVTFARPTS
jgi:hypothetical protein